MATLSSNPLASDDYMRALILAGQPAADRQASVAGPKGSAARTALFQLRVSLIEAFLDHDNGEAARAAVTPDTAGPGTGGTGSMLPPPEIEPSATECRLRVARADRADAVPASHASIRRSSTTCLILIARGTAGWPLRRGGPTRHGASKARQCQVSPSDGLRPGSAF